MLWGGGIREAPIKERHLIMVLKVRMMKKYRKEFFQAWILVIAPFVFIPFWGYSQNCQKSINVSPVQGAVTIPVVFHIIGHPDTIAKYNMDPDLSGRDYYFDLVEKQMVALNLAFNDGLVQSSSPIALQNYSANANIHFQLATTDPEGYPTSGIEYRESPENFIVKLRKDGELEDGDFSDVYRGAQSSSGFIPWETDRYLNIWVLTIKVVDQNGNPNAALSGFGVYPWEGENLFPGSAGKQKRKYEGVYLNSGIYNAENKSKYFGEGAMTLAHEIGHYLGLLHPFEGGCATGDCVDDTPSQPNSSYDILGEPKLCPTVPQSTTSCDGTPYGNIGLPFMNIMDYMPNDCMTSFTQGQVERMRQYLAPYSGGDYRSRYGLIDPANPALNPCNVSHPGEPNNHVLEANTAFSNANSPVGKAGLTMSIAKTKGVVANCDKQDFYQIVLEVPGSCKFFLHDPWDDLEFELIGPTGQILESATYKHSNHQVLTICRTDASSQPLQAWLRVKAKKEGAYQYQLGCLWDPTMTCATPTPVPAPGSGTGLVVIPEKTVACSNLPEKIEVDVLGGSGQYRILDQFGNDVCTEGCTSSTLTIWTPQNVGTYQFTVFDELGSENFASFDFTVVESPSIDDIPIQTAPTQGTVSFSMNASGGTPPYTYFWEGPLNTTYNVLAPVSSGSRTSPSVSFLLSGAAWLDPLEVVASVTDVNGCKVKEYTGYNQPPNNGTMFTVSRYTATRDNPIILTPSGNWNFSTAGSGFQLFPQTDGTALAYSSTSFSPKTCHLGSLVGGRQLRLCWVKSPVSSSGASANIDPGGSYRVDVTSVGWGGAAHPGVKYTYQWVPDYGVSDPHSLVTTITPPAPEYDQYQLIMKDSLGGESMYTLNFSFLSPPPLPNLAFGPDGDVGYNFDRVDGDLPLLKSALTETSGSGFLAYNLNVINNGSMPTDSSTTASIMMADEDTVILVDQILITPGLSPQQKISIQDSFDVTYLPEGEYNFLSLLDVADQEAQQINTDDIWMGQGGNIAVFPDVIVDQLKLNGDTFPTGAMIIIDGFTGNLGPRILQGGYEFNIWISSDYAIDETDSLIYSGVTSQDFLPGEGQSFSTSWMIPAIVADSNLVILVEVDVTDSQVEVNESNVFAIPFWIGEKQSVGIDASISPSPLTIIPNPFSESTSIQFDSRQVGEWKMTLFSLNGQIVQQEAFTLTSPGPQHLSVSGKELAYGMYLVVLQAPDGQLLRGKLMFSP